MGGVRRDVASLEAGWNKPLEHYALAMRALDELPITDRNSWRFLAAMHGFRRDGWVAARIIKETDPVPADLTNRTYGNQCQHGSWYFLPWHRGYLAAFEAIVAAKVKELTGEDWSLPYWNYLDSTNPDATKIPEAFLAPTLPDGTANPLRKYPRRSGISELPAVSEDDFSLNSMAENDFLVGRDGSIGFGGGVTGNLGSEQEEFEIVRLGRTHHERRWMSSAGSCGLSSRRVGFDFLICPTRQRFSQMAVYRDGRWQSGSFSKSKIDGSFSTYRSMRTA